MIRSKIRVNQLLFFERNQVTAFSAHVIDIGAVYIIANNIYKERQYREIQQEKAIEFQKRQRFNNANTFCREEADEGLYRELNRLDLTSSAWKYLTDCMNSQGYANVDCGRYGVCKQK